MTIRRYEKDGKVFYGAYLDLKSKSRKDIRLQRKKEGLTTYNEAQAAQKNSKMK